MSVNIFGQSTKESYRCDIEDSRKQKTLYKNYEYFDDYSYGNSDAIGVIINKHNNKKYVTFFQNDGPKTVIVLKKLLEWRRSGDSNEIGHKGGGNKRNIYGFNSDKVEIISKISETEFLKCETNPNKLYELSLSDIDEQSFRNISDSSTYIKSPELVDPDYVPRWYDNIYTTIQNESGIEPNYLIRMEMSEFPQEYVDENLWKEYIIQVRAKQYDIDIYFKNEIVSMDTYEKYENIDLIGFHDKNKIKPKLVDLFIKKDDNSFYFKEGNSYIHVKTNEQIDYNENIVKWGGIENFIVSKDYFNEQLKEYNKCDNPLRAEDFYGVYFKINNKITNYLPIEGKPLGDSRNNNVDVEEGQKNNGRLRMIIIPDETVCSQNTYFDSLIKTETIKALSGFLDRSPYKEILDTSKRIYKGISIIKPKVPRAPRPKIIKKKKDGGIYLIYLGENVYKFGCVKDYNRITERILEHRRDSIKKVKEFTRKNLNHLNATLLLEFKTDSPKGCEEKIANILINESKKSNLILYQNHNSGNDIREYFKCDNIDYIIQELIPMITSQNI